MASKTLRHRPADDPSMSSDPANLNKSERRARKLVLARKGLRSLAVAVTVPLILTALVAYVSGSSASFPSKPTWHPPVWVFHVASAITASLMGLSGWLVWTAGAFHQEQAVLSLYLAQFFLGLTWGPLVFGLAAARAGLAVCLAQFSVMFTCARCFRKVNPFAGDLVKPCLAWVSFLAVFSYKLL